MLQYYTILFKLKHILNTKQSIILNAKSEFIGITTLYIQNERWIFNLRFAEE